MEHCDYPMGAALGLKPLAHFVTLARNGGQPGPSSGENRARTLACCVLDEVGGLDDVAAEGLIEFIREARVRPAAAKSAIGAK